MLRPLEGHPKELQEFVDNHLEAPFEGSNAGRKAVTQKLFANNPGLEDQVKKLVARKEKEAAEKAERRAAAEAAGEVFTEDETAKTYHPAVEDDDGRQG